MNFFANIFKKTVFIYAIIFSLSAYAEMPLITGKPMIDTAPILDWKLDNKRSTPNLHNPTSNTLFDFHGNLHTCDLLLSSEGNYHMALQELWPEYLAQMKINGISDVFYTTSPPVFVSQIETQNLQFDNLNIKCKPSIVVATKSALTKLADKGFIEGDLIPLYQDRGVVLLVKKGNPKNIKTVWDLAREGVHLVTPNPEFEQGAYQNYQDAIYNIAKQSVAPVGMTAEKLINVIFNGQSNDKYKWLAGIGIHHRDLPWSVAYGRADVGVILYHLGRYTKDSFPEQFDIVVLGGTFEDPQPLPGVKTSVRFAAMIKGDWTDKQAMARKELMADFKSERFTDILISHGLTRPRH